jgi:hypothetical protein
MFCRALSCRLLICFAAGSRSAQQLQIADEGFPGDFFVGLILDSEQ